MKFAQLALAKVEAQYPEEMRVGVVFRSGTPQYKVKVSGAVGHRLRGNYSMPPLHAWGVVLFTQDHSESSEWLFGLDDELWHSAPLELLKDDPAATVTYHADGGQDIRRSNGDMERTFRDGSILQIGSSTDGQPTPRHITVNSQGQARKAARQAHTLKKGQAVNVTLTHSSGAVLKISKDGDVRVRDAGGSQVRLEKGTGNIHVQAAGNVIVDAAQDILLGGEAAAQAVAREFDDLTITALDGLGLPVTFLTKFISPRPGAQVKST